MGALLLQTQNRSLKGSQNSGSGTGTVNVLLQRLANLDARYHSLGTCQGLGKMKSPTQATGSQCPSTICFKHASLGLVYIATDELHWSICHMTLQIKGKGLVEVALVCLLSVQNVSLIARIGSKLQRKSNITIRSCTYQLHKITEKCTASKSFSVYPQTAGLQQGLCQVYLLAW